MPTDPVQRRSRIARTQARPMVADLAETWLKTISQYQLKKMSKTRVVMLVCVTILGLLIILCAALILHRNSLMAGYNQLQYGDTKQMVIDKLGRPQMILECRNTDSAADPYHRCRQGYWYDFFIERWIVYLDENDIVIDKSYAVGY